MKKSKFMQSSKDMLSRSFNPSKCKTSLRLAGSRLKLLRNKKEVQVKQMKREIAQLLESGQDQTARIRVEHVVREEKMMAAYDLIQIYCELIIARLPIIESQKNCPIDLKEAIASIIFASPRCGDVPELLDVKKQFTAKYGKDFVTAAIEVRPACGVSRMLVEKLSAIAPDGPTKIKILTAIAEEHNVQWDHKSFDEKDPPNDLLSGPSTFGSGSQPYVDPSPVVSQDVQAPPSNTMHGSQINVSYQDKTSPLNASTSFQHKERPPDRQQNWPMEFKDATSAAQAAAESAERASMAAKSASEFANGGKITRQYSTESRYVSKDEEEPESYLNTKRTSERISEQHMDRPYSERTRSQNEQLDGINANRTRTGENFEEYGRGSKKVYSQSSSPKSKASIDEEFLDQGVPAVEGYCRKNSLKEDPRGEIRMKKQSFKHEAESRNEWPDKSEYIREEKIRKQPSVKSYRSHSSASDELNIFANSERPNFGYDTDNDSFVKGDVHGEDFLASVRFDKFDSDVDDHHGFDIGPGPAYDEPSQKSTAHLSINRDSWGVGSSSIKTVESTSSPFFAKKNSFSESLKSVNDFEQDNFKPVKFDDSDGPISDIDEEINMSKRTGIKDSSDHDRSGKFKDERGSSFKEKRYSGFHKEDLTVSSDEESKYMGKSQGKNSYADSPKKSGLKKSSADVAQPNDYSEELDTGNREGLNFEKLRGGFRHKGDKHSPFLKNQLDGSSSPKGVHSPVESPKMSKMADHKNRTTLPAPEADSDSDSSEEEVLLRKSSIQKPKIKPKLSVGSSNSIFGSDNSDLDEDSPKEKRFSKKSHFSGGISRRTKTSPKSSGTGTYSKTRLSSGALDFNGGMDKKPTTSYISEESDSQNKQESYERPSSEKLASKPARSNFWGPPEQPYTLKADSVTKQESKGQVRYEERDSDDIGERKPKNYSLKTEQESAPKPNNSNFLRTPERVSSESPQAATSNRTSSSKDDGLKRAGHVHPKLPDYDFLVQSLRINRS